jgi:hypothetical protein
VISAPERRGFDDDDAERQAQDQSIAAGKIARARIQLGVKA